MRGYRANLEALMCFTYENLIVRTEIHDFTSQRIALFVKCNGEIEWENRFGDNHAWFDNWDDAKDYLGRKVTLQKEIALGSIMRYDEMIRRIEDLQTESVAK